MYRTLISPSELAEHFEDARCRVVDCRFDLANPSAGEQWYGEAHIPGAHYAHLDRDLSGDTTGSNGRHPLPTPEQMRERFSALGIAADGQVVVYDADSGMHASRLWWMLRYMGHDAVAVLDGGFARWTREGFPIRGGREERPAAAFEGDPRQTWLVGADDVLRTLGQRSPVLVDARADTRFRGEEETLDPRGGHIPGARNFFFQRNLNPDKTFRPADALRRDWQQALSGTSPQDAVMYCGSGVTACHNLLALEHVGLSGARLYAGSWSEWSSDPQRPIATGEA